MSSGIPVAKGSLDVLVLKALSIAPMHGLEIARWLEHRSRDAVEIEDNALYQAVHRMEERGLVRASWATTENNRRARYYNITPAGRSHLRAEAKVWLGYAEFLTELLNATS